MILFFYDFLEPHKLKFMILPIHIIILIDMTLSDSLLNLMLTIMKKFSLENWELDTCTEIIVIIKFKRLFSKVNCEISKNSSFSHVHLEDHFHNIIQSRREVETTTIVHGL